ncbi:MAG: SNF2-related protein [Micropruina glycogenica]
MVTSYTLVRLDEDEYVDQPWSVVLLDEAQFVKNRQARRHQSVRKLRARTQFAITGTPLENNLMDLWALLSIVSPRLFADPAVFTERYRRPIENGSRPRGVGAATERVRPLMLRRTKRRSPPNCPRSKNRCCRSSCRRLPPVYDKQLAAERKKVLGLVDDLA